MRFVSAVTLLSVNGCDVVDDNTVQVFCSIHCNRLQVSEGIVVESLLKTLKTKLNTASKDNAFQQIILTLWHWEKRDQGPQV